MAGHKANKPNRQHSTERWIKTKIPSDLYVRLMHHKATTGETIQQAVSRGVAVILPKTS